MAQVNQMDSPRTIIVIGTAFLWMLVIGIYVLMRWVFDP